MKKNCFCGSDKPFSACCKPLIAGQSTAVSAEALMRSRYCAYVMAAVDYLMATTHPSKRMNHNAKDILQWAKSNQWQRLEILHADTFTVTFKAHYRDRTSRPQIHYEKSTFVRENGIWYYLDGEFFKN
jgi:SEC-C motif domain protein